MPAAEAVVEHLVTERRVTRLGVDRAAPDPPSPPTSAPMNEELPQDLPNGPHVGMEVTTAPAEEDLDLPVEGLRPRTIVAEGRSEELVVERLRVTTIVRVVLNDVTTEYRRVAHYHGGVTHFMNGSPCSEAVYREGTGH